MVKESLELSKLTATLGCFSAGEGDGEDGWLLQHAEPHHDLGYLIPRLLYGPRPG